jgi:hypothetical protein
LFCALVVPSHRTRMSGGRGCPVVVSCSSSPGSRSGWRPPAVEENERASALESIRAVGLTPPALLTRSIRQAGSEGRKSSEVLVDGDKVSLADESVGKTFTDEWRGILRAGT